MPLGPQPFVPRKGRFNLDKIGDLAECVRSAHAQLDAAIVESLELGTPLASIAGVTGVSLNTIRRRYTCSNGSAVRPRWGTWWPGMRSD